jgi:prepilin-type N-terminal cleavage/methylation domain-containing protein
MRALRAFSIIELLTALVLLGVGLAAVVRATAAIARLENDARLTHVVAAALLARLDTLAGLPCGVTRSGFTAHQGVHERWSVVPNGRQLLLADTIDVPARPALSRRASASLGCRP